MIDKLLKQLYHDTDNGLLSDAECEHYLLCMIDAYGADYIGERLCSLGLV